MHEDMGGGRAAQDRPFVLLASRSEQPVADEEYEAFCRFMDLPPARLQRVRLDQAPMPPIDLDAVAGIVVAGSPFTSSDPQESKSEVQKRVEREIGALLMDVCERDIPFLGACYGVGTLGVHLGGVVDTTYGEPVGAVPVALTAAGLSDPLLAGLPEVFDAYVGHKEALRAAPAGTTLLASSPGAPVQMLRYRQNVYATQFHPELDAPGIVSRLRAYRDKGYYDPAEIDAVIARVESADVSASADVLRNFARRYG